MLKLCIAYEGMSAREIGEVLSCGQVSPTTMGGDITASDPASHHRSLPL